MSNTSVRNARSRALMHQAALLGLLLGIATVSRAPSAPAPTDQPAPVGVCTAGTCSVAPRCGDGEKCCAGTDGGASCGSCCSAGDCADGVTCTVDLCVDGRCYNAVGKCDAGYTCDPADGCTKDVECEGDEECTGSSCGRCEGGICSYGCGAGLTCCGDSCQQCCDSADCFDGIDCTDNACVGGVCQFTPNNAKCPLLQKCVIARGGCALL
jgi:hypothetical protein